MSSTISASLKRNVPRKKILAERNENLENPENPESKFSKTLIDKPTILDPANPLSHVTVLSMVFCQRTVFINQLSLARPKFIGYNPNRRKEIFLRRVQEINESKDGFDSVRSSLVSLSYDVEHEDDDVEEVEETQRKILKLNEVLKCFLLFAVVVFSAFCIVRMNSPEFLQLL
ncbi:hypothetical protein RJ641_024090 [Dillenia turbinata]|uniref:Uncharacterized protein n=1 Tax=Dillenia turbinata TaxID=194707 RepID=A0AAN8UKQ9_9MAGN